MGRLRFPKANGRATRQRPGLEPRIEESMNKAKLSENEIRPADLMREKEWAVESDKEYLRERRSRFVNVDCPACGSTRSSHWGDKEGFTYRKCDGCGTLYMNPRPSVGLLEEFYRQSRNYEIWNTSIFPATEGVRKERIFVPRARRTIDLCRTYGIDGGTLLEIGAAFGTFCEAARDEGFFDRIVAVEPTPGLAATCRSKGFETLEEPVEKLGFPHGVADVVAAYEVIEHLWSPREFITRCAEFLRPGGLLICSCPSGDGFGTLLIREKAKTVDHEHLNYLNPGSVAVLLERCGLLPLEITTPGLLDVDMLVNQLAEDDSIRVSCPVLSRLLGSGDADILSRLQGIIAEAKLSSHLWFVARKV